MLRFQIETFPTGSTNLGAYLPGMGELLTDKPSASEENGSVGPCTLSAEIPTSDLQSFDME